MRRQSSGLGMLKSGGIVFALLVTSATLTSSSGCGGGDGGNSDPIVVPTPTPTPAPTPFILPTASPGPPSSSQPVIVGRSYKITIPLAGIQRFVANIKVVNTNTITGGATIIIIPEMQDEYADIAGQIIDSNSGSAMSIAGDFVFYQESNLDASGLGGPSEVTRSIRLYGILPDAIGRESQATLTTAGVEYVGVVTLIDVPVPSPAPPPAEPGFEAKMIGQWRAVAVPEAPLYPLGSVLELSGGRNTYTVNVPTQYEEGEIFTSSERRSGTWSSEQNLLKLDELEYAYDGDDSQTFSPDEIEVEDNSDDAVSDDYRRYSVTFSENRMTIYDPLFAETHVFERM